MSKVLSRNLCYLSNCIPRLVLFVSFGDACECRAINFLHPRVDNFFKNTKNARHSRIEINYFYKELLASLFFLTVQRSHL
jgi:hypothetical protein